MNRPEYNKRYYEEHKEEKLTYYQKHREEILERNKSPEVRERIRKWQHKRYEEIKQNGLWS